MNFALIIVTLIAATDTKSDTELHRFETLESCIAVKNALDEITPIQTRGLASWHEQTLDPDNRKNMQVRPHEPVISVPPYFSRLTRCVELTEATSRSEL